jgi:hypothetical protein
MHLYGHGRGTLERFNRSTSYVTVFHRVVLLSSSSLAFEYLECSGEVVSQNGQVLLPGFLGHVVNLTCEQFRVVGREFVSVFAYPSLPLIAHLERFGGEHVCWGRWWGQVVRKVQSACLC